MDFSDENADILEELLFLHWHMFAESELLKNTIKIIWNFRFLYIACIDLWALFQEITRKFGMKSEVVSEVFTEVENLSENVLN